MAKKKEEKKVEAKAISSVVVCKLCRHARGLDGKKGDPKLCECMKRPRSYMTQNGEWKEGYEVMVASVPRMCNEFMYANTN